MATKIDTYTVVYSSGNFHRRIWLYNGGKGIGQLVFVPNNINLPADYEDRAGVNMHYHRYEFPFIIDVLRNEDPVFLQWNGVGSENSIKTSEELAGEGE